MVISIDGAVFSRLRARLNGHAGTETIGSKPPLNQLYRLLQVWLSHSAKIRVTLHPEHQEHLIVNKKGEPYKHENYLGDAVSTWRDSLKIRSELRLYDARGTAATRLLDAGAELREVATHMGWSIKHAAEVIERYVALSPSMSDGLAEKLKRARK